MLIILTCEFLLLCRSPSDAVLRRADSAAFQRSWSAAKVPAASSSSPCRSRGIPGSSSLPAGPQPAFPTSHARRAAAAALPQRRRPTLPSRRCTALPRWRWRGDAAPCPRRRWRPHDGRPEVPPATLRCSDARRPEDAHAWTAISTR